MDKADAQIKKVAVIGAGTMGIEIAASSFMAGYAEFVKDVDENLLAQASTDLTIIIENDYTRGKGTTASANEALDALSFTINSDAIADAELIIEAVPERIELKRALSAGIDAHAPVSAVLATNTSSLSVNALASVTNPPDWIVGMHFINSLIS